MALNWTDFVWTYKKYTGIYGIPATTLEGKTWEAPGTIGSTTPNTGAFTTVSATTFTGALVGNASTATTLATARTINGVSFNGSANIGQDLQTSASPTFVGATFSGAVSGITTLGATGRFTSTQASGLGLYLHGSDTSANYLQIDSSGGNMNLGLEGSVAGTNWTGSDAYATVLGTTNATNLNFACNFTVRAKLTSTGFNSTAIGATTPSTGVFTTLSTTGTATLNSFISTQASSVGNGGTGLLGLGGLTASFPAIRYDAATVVGCVLADQSAYCSIKATAFTLSSDGRFKQEVEPFTSSGDMIDALQPVRYNEDATKPMHSAGRKGLIGFIAQDVYSIFPQAVTKGDDGEEIVNEWGVDYAQLGSPIVVAELKSLRARVAQLEAA